MDDNNSMQINPISMAQIISQFPQKDNTSNTNKKII